MSVLPRHRFLLISNPIAGRVGRSLLAPVVAKLEQSGAVITRPCDPTIEAAGDAIRSAARDGTIDAVVAAGGDGTLRMVAAGLLDTSVPVGLVPLGTGNVMAHELALPADPGELAQLLLQGPTVPLHAIRANGEPFFLMAGAGFDGAVVAGLDHRWKHRLSKLAYVPPVLAALRQPLPRLEVKVDGVRHGASWAIVANACRYGGRFRLVPHTHALDDGLHAVLFQARDRLTLTARLLDLARGNLLGRPDVLMLPCRRVSIRANGPVPVQIDGDAAGTTPLDIEGGDRAVQLIVPEAIARGSARRRLAPLATHRWPA